MSIEKPSWNDRYSFGIDEIDEQHRVLFGYLDTLESALKTEERWSVVHEVLVKLAHWVEVHFAVEEALMNIMRFPEARKHRESHAGFARKLEENTSKLLHEDIAVETADWLRDWLIHHIAIEDRAYAEHFKRCVRCPDQADGYSS